MLTHAVLLLSRICSTPLVHPALLICLGANPSPGTRWCKDCRVCLLCCAAMDESKQHESGSPDAARLLCCIEAVAICQMEYQKHLLHAAAPLGKPGILRVRYFPPPRAHSAIPATHSVGMINTFLLWYNVTNLFPPTTKPCTHVLLPALLCSQPSFSCSRCNPAAYTNTKLLFPPYPAKEVVYPRQSFSTQQHPNTWCMPICSTPTGCGSLGETRTEQT